MKQPNNKLADSAISNSPLPEGCPQDGVSPLRNSCYFINGTKINFQLIQDPPYNKFLKDRAKALRYAENLSEVLFWMRVTKRRFHKIDFDRQRVIGNYIVDFYVKKLGLIIEIDGSSHDNKIEYDKKRENYLKSFGLKVYRIKVGNVMKNMDFALMGLENYIIENYS